MSLAAASMRGACLNCRFAVNGIQNALRSFGVTLSRFDMTKLSFQVARCGDANGWSNQHFRATQILTDWTNVSTAKEAVKGLIAEMRLAQRPPQIGKNWSRELGQKSFRLHRA